MRLSWLGIPDALHYDNAHLSQHIHHCLVTFWAYPVPAMHFHHGSNTISRARSQRVSWPTHAKAPQMGVCPIPSSWCSAHGYGTAPPPTVVAVVAAVAVAAFGVGSSSLGDDAELARDSGEAWLPLNWAEVSGLGQNRGMCLVRTQLTCLSLPSHPKNLQAIGSEV